MSVMPLMSQKIETMIVLSVCMKEKTVRRRDTKGTGSGARAWPGDFLVETFQPYSSVVSI